MGIICTKGTATVTVSYTSFLFFGLQLFLSKVHPPFPTSGSAPESCLLDVYQQMYQCKLDLRVSRRSDLSAQVDLHYDQLSSHLHCAFEAASEQGASCWLTTLPIAEHGFALSKGEFHDALCLRFGWQPVYLPQMCVLW